MLCLLFSCKLLDGAPLCPTSNLILLRSIRGMAIYLLQIVYESQNILIDLGKQISETFIHIFPNTLWSVFRINPYLYSNT